MAAVYKTPFTADVSLDKSRRDSWGTISSIEEVTTNAASSEAVRLDFPSSYGFGLSWRPRDTLTLSADFTRTHWSEARIQNYFELSATQPSDNGVPAVPPPPVVYPDRQYPTLRPVPDPSDPADPLRLQGQQDAEQFRVGVEWVLIRGGLKVPLRAGYFNDRQIEPVLGGNPPRFNGLANAAAMLADRAEQVARMLNAARHALAQLRHAREQRVARQVGMRPRHAAQRGQMPHRLAQQCVVLDQRGKRFRGQAGHARDRLRRHRLDARAVERIERRGLQCVDEERGAVAAAGEQPEHGVSVAAAAVRCAPHAPPGIRRRRAPRRRASSRDPANPRR